MKTFQTPILVRLFLASLACSAAFSSETAPYRGRLDLDGTWNFATDPDGTGEANRWFDASVALPAELPEGYAPKEPGKIQVPGIWDAQGYGVENDKVKHNFVGKGWYKRTVSVPKNWEKDDSIFLVLQGISRYAKVWIDGNLVGPEAIGCIGSHEWNVSQFLTPGKEATVAICVDSAQRWDVDPLLGAASLNDYLEIKWGGLWGHVYLESRPKTRLDSLYLRTKLWYDDKKNVTRAVCQVDATVLDENKTPDFKGTLRLQVFDSNSNCVNDKLEDVNLDLSSGQADVSAAVQIPNPKLWTPDSPYLYRVRATLVRSQRVDALESTYGAREIKFDGNRILLNGKPFFLRGYGDDHIYPIEFSMPTDINMYRERLKIIKSFGFNHCRHHSCILPHEYYDACDELGMLPNGEMLLGYPQQLPGEGDLWKRNVPEGADPKPALDTIKERWAQVVKEYRNHPSIFIWVGGNELCMLGLDRWNAMTLGPECMEIAKKFDPDRYFTDCDGDFLKDYVAFGGRPAQEFYSILFDEWSNPVLNRNKFKTDAKFDKPTVSHEAGNFLTFSRQDQVELFKDSNYKPFWMTAGKAKLEELGLDGEVEAWARASEQLYLLSHKYNVEGVRRNEALSGYHWWLIQDYWTTSNGIVDLFFRPKSLKPEDLLPFNNDVVLLQEGLDFTYRSGDEAKLTFMISNFAPKAKTGVATWSFLPANADAGNANWPQETKLTAEPTVAPNGKLTAFADVRFVCPEVERPTQGILKFSWKGDDETEYENTWNAFVFPKEIAPKTAKQVYADETAIQFFPKEWNVKPLAELNGELPTDAVYAVAWADPEIVAAAKAGAGVLHFGGSQFFAGLPVRFQQTWWKAGDSETQNNTGTYVYPNAISDDVVYGNFCGAAWAPLLDGAVKYNVETKNPRPEIFVRALSSLVLVRDEALLLEVGLGKGKLLVSGLNHAEGQNSPIGNWLLARMIDEAASDAPAKVQWDADSIMPKIVVPDGVTLGFERLGTYSESGVWNSYRSMNHDVPNWVCRQNKVDSAVSWKTATVKSADEEKVTFLFAGGTGYATTAKSKGFELSFNGQALIPFDVVETFDGQTTAFAWSSADGSATLEFEAKKELAPNDKYGIFKLTVPASLVKPNQAQDISVRSLGDGSSRWFGINLYTDFSDLAPSAAQ
ncbi:MAG: hypothetical protein IKS14_02210 [Thermoguttaceae bacterium]|nr:hypothetical protein [Thermoguttaceae bacterium]